MMSITVYQFTLHRRYKIVHVFHSITQHNLYVTSPLILPVPLTKFWSVREITHHFPRLSELTIPKPDNGVPAAPWCRISIVVLSIVPTEVVLIPFHVASQPLESLHLVPPCWSACPSGISVRLSVCRYQIHLQLAPLWGPGASWSSLSPFCSQSPQSALEFSLIPVDLIRCRAQGSSCPGPTKFSSHNTSLPSVSPHSSPEKCFLVWE